MPAYHNNFLEVHEVQQEPKAVTSYEPMMIEHELVRSNDGDVIVAEVDYNAT